MPPVLPLSVYHDQGIDMWCEVWQKNQQHECSRKTIARCDVSQPGSPASVLAVNDHGNQLAVHYIKHGMFCIALADIQICTLMHCQVVIEDPENATDLHMGVQPLYLTVHQSHWRCSAFHQHQEAEHSWLMQ